MIRRRRADRKLVDLCQIRPDDLAYCLTVNVHRDAEIERLVGALRARPKTSVTHPRRCRLGAGIAAVLAATRKLVARAAQRRGKHLKDAGWPTQHRAVVVPRNGREALVKTGLL